MFRRVAPGLLWLALALGVLAVPVCAAEDTPSVEDVVARSLAGDLRARRSATESAIQGSVPLAGPIDPETYRLGPGDRLLVQWAGRVTRTETVEVGPAGDVFLPEIGTLAVSGQTLAAARLTIIDRLRRITRDVRVEVQLARPRMFRVYLSGAIDNPGPIETAAGSRVSDIVRLDGLKPGASTRNLQVRRRDGSSTPADLERVFRLGDHSRDALLLDGDAVVVPYQTEFVHIVGAVALPGTVERAADDSVSTLVRLAGGPRPDAAPDAQWIHWSTAARPETLAIDVPAVLAGRGDAPLANGDRVFVRAQPGFRLGGGVLVEGDVQRPGGYPVAPTGTRLSEVLAAAGGLLPTADASGVRLKRLATGPVPTEAELAKRARTLQRELSVSEFEVQQAQAAAQSGEWVIDRSGSQRAGSSADPVLLDGDVITVPRQVNALRIDGQVGAPGVVSYVPGLSLQRYVELAGGYSARAWRGHEQITRAGSPRTLLAKSAGGIRPGDAIWVPLRPDESAWKRTTEILAALAQVATIVIAVRSVN